MFDFSGSFQIYAFVIHEMLVLYVYVDLSLLETFWIFPKIKPEIDFYQLNL